MQDDYLELLYKNVREFCEKKVSPLADEIDSKDYIPERLYQDLAEQGLMTMLVPEELGGLGLSYSSYVQILSIVSEYSAGVSLSLEAHNSLGLEHIIRYGDDRMKELAISSIKKGAKPVAWALTEPRGGSDARGIVTRAEKRGGSYILNGSKIFITHGFIADLIVTIARSEKGITAFLVDGSSAGLTRSKLEGKLGTRGPDTSTLIFDNVEVPAENVIGEEGKGFDQAMEVLDGGRIAVGGMGVGISSSCLKSSIQYVQQRKAFGSKVSEFQGVRFEIAEIATQMEAARQLVMHAAKLRDEGKPHRKEAAMAKYFSSQVAMSAARLGVQLHGGYGFFRGTPVERFYRDAKLLEIGEGTNEVLKMVIAKELIK